MKTISLLFVLLLPSLVLSQDIPSIARRIPPPGIDISVDDRTQLTSQLRTLQERIANSDHDSIADVSVFAKAVDYALQHDEFYSKNDAQVALTALQTGHARLEQLNAGTTPWSRKTGLVVRGYISDIDGSPQPYGLEIPEKFDFDKPVPLYVWLHGRGDKTTDLHFIHQRSTRAGQIHPAGAIVVHPFGRHCIGFKSAGEIDVLDVIDHVKSQYKIDPNRIVLMGFSMGGAGAWHMGAHYADRFVALSPGAGFAETAQYTNLARADFPPKYEQALWNVYDVPSYTRNLFNLPVIAYSGELDKQIQAARVMETAFKNEGRELTHIIGPGMGHKYHPDSLKKILSEIADTVRVGNVKPEEVHLQTRTLRYNRMDWVRALRLHEHWQDSRIDAKITDLNKVTVTTKNITAFRMSPWEDNGGLIAVIDGQEITLPHRNAVVPHASFVKTDGKWSPVPGEFATNSLAKTPGLQGPIDDAFLEPFLVVLPSGKSKHEKLQRWVEFELSHFQNRWRTLYRGDVRVKRDDEITDEDFAKYHLILWGDPVSNKLIARLQHSLPIRWEEEKIIAGEQKYDASNHAPICIHPNPLYLTKYVVLNSGPTHRENHDRTNSLQNPKLPDWAIINLDTPPDGDKPGKVVDAGFFGEGWEYTK